MPVLGVVLFAAVVGGCWVLVMARTGHLVDAMIFGERKE